MSEPLQQFDWKSSSYERPGDNWVCGKACEGCSCALGPTAVGECSVQSQCEPQLVGDRWKCTRPAIHGGKCKDGPDPNGKCCQADESCRPVMSRRRRRRIAGLLCASLSLAVCLIAVATPDTQSLISPGKVTSAHAAIESSCSSCHVAADDGHLVGHAFSAHDQFADSRKCLVCHRDFGSEPLVAHSIDSHSLAMISAAADRQGTPPVALQLASLARSTDREAQMACSDCHREHQGRTFDLKRISDQQCQVCHKDQFSDFAHGHPEFGSYPHERRTAIYFDHARHLDVYFEESEFRRQMPDGIPRAECAACHVADNAGDMILTRGYERMCGSCHDGQITELKYPGVPFFALPQRTAEFDSAEIGTWPATEDSLREMPPVMTRLLESVAASDKPAEDAQSLPWRIKKLLLDLQTHGDVALRDRLGEKHQLLTDAIRRMVPVITQASVNWFPKLSEEVAAHESESELPADAEAVSQVSRTPQSLRGWYVDQRDHTVRYRPVGHADPVMQKLLQYLTTRGPEDDPSEMDDLLRVLAHPNGSAGIAGTGPLATGRCLSCHSSDFAGNGVSRINWYARRLPIQREFTEFSHRPHTLSMESDSCKSCHRLSEPSDSDSYRADYFLRDSTGSWELQLEPQCPSAAGLRPIDRAQCASCHHRTGTSQSCLQCHNYHVHAP